MRVLLLLARFFAAGQTNHVIDLARGLGLLGHEVVLVYTQPGSGGQIHRRVLATALTERGIPVFEDDLGGGLPKGLPAPDIIHAHSTLDFRRASELSARLGVPYVLTLHGLGVSGRSFAPYVAKASKVIAVGHRVAEEAAAITSRVVTIENGVDTERFRPDGATVRGGWGPFTVVYAGRIDPAKRYGFRQFCRAIVRLDDRVPTRLILLAVTMPEPEPALRRRLATIIDFRGWLADPAPVLRAADVVVGSGRVVREAMASGRPALVLGPSYGGLVFPDSLNPARGHDFSGRAAGAGDESCNPARIARDLARLATDPQLARRLGEEGRAYACKHLGLERMVELTEEVYEDVSSGRVATSRRPVRAGEPEPRARRAGRVSLRTGPPPVSPEGLPVARVFAPRRPLRQPPPRNRD